MNYVEINNFSLKQYNTLRIESNAKIIVFPLNNNGVREIYQKYSDSKIIILGNGSNILLSKDYYDDSYTFLSFKMMDNINYYDSQIYCEAGTPLSKLSWFALEHGFKGYEFLEDVPGSMGGAIIMNAGTYKDNIGQLVECINYYDITQDEIIIERVSSQDFERRKSKWTDSNSIILSSQLSASEGQKVSNYEDIIDNLFLIKKKRYLKQPRNYPNAGSVFKRPSLNGEDFYIWKLFEELGLRGYQKNGAMISDKHPGFIVNVNNAKSEDVLFLINLAREKVKKRFGIELELEWKII
ncbi:UDP-N-acetylmuramate dehydrogenase [Oceanobacillus longus]|uniref:UDP-N-acetylenolpyruvoylglucosamine reductase n=1 Tax=Oceanobacillus longus TaxID=930120 RepID=A0ABV8H417_9BACI